MPFVSGAAWIRPGTLHGNARLIKCVVGMLIDTNTLYFEATIVNSDLARKAMLKAAIVHVVVFVGASIIYLVKCGDPQTETRQVEGLGQEYQSVN